MIICHKFYSFLMYFQTHLAKSQVYIYERDWSKFVQQNLFLDYFDKDWSDVAQLDQQESFH